MFNGLYLMQIFQSVPPPERLVMTYSVLTTTSSFLATEWLSRRASVSSSPQELMDVLHLAQDWQ